MRSLKLTMRLAKVSGRQHPVQELVNENAFLVHELSRQKAIPRAHEPVSLQKEIDSGMVK